MEKTRDKAERPDELRKSDADFLEFSRRAKLEQSRRELRKKMIIAAAVLLSLIAVCVLPGGGNMMLFFTPLPFLVLSLIGVMAVWMVAEFWFRRRLARRAE